MAIGRRTSIRRSPGLRFLRQKSTQKSARNSRRIPPSVDQPLDRAQRATCLVDHQFQNPSPAQPRRNLRHRPHRPRSGHRRDEPPPRQSRFAHSCSPSEGPKGKDPAASSQPVKGEFLAKGRRSGPGQVLMSSKQNLRRCYISMPCNFVQPRTNPRTPLPPCETAGLCPKVRP